MTTCGECKMVFVDLEAYFEHTCLSSALQQTEFDFELVDDDKTQKICIKHVEGITPVSLAEKHHEVWIICKRCGAAIRPATERKTPLWKLPNDWPKI